MDGNVVPRTVAAWALRALMLGMIGSLVLYALAGHQIIYALYTSDWLQDTVMTGRAVTSLKTYYTAADGMMLRVGVLGITLPALFIGEPTRRWLVVAGVLSLTLIEILHTNPDAIVFRAVLVAIFLLALFAPEPTSRWLLTAGALSFAAFMFFWRLGEGSLYDTDEAVYAQISKEMVLSGTWITPHLNGVPFIQKPPLNFWLTAVAYKLLGINEFAARLWSAIYSFGTVVLVFLLASRLRSYVVGVGAACFLLVNDQSYFAHWHNFLSLSRVGMLDSALTFWIAAALVLAWEAERRPWLITLIGFPLGFAVMTKAWSGLFAIILPALYLLAVRRTQFLDQLRYWIVALVLAAVVILPWHLWEFWLYGNRFIHEYFAVTLLGRVTGLVEQQQASRFFYVDVLREGFVFWEYFLLMAYILTLWAAFKAKDRKAGFLLIWITVPLVLFSLAQTKLGWYISLIYPGIALLIALQLARLLGDRLATAAILTLFAFYIQLPKGAHGSPDITRFLADVDEYVHDPDKTVYVVNQACDRPPSNIYDYGNNHYAYQQVRSSLLFYLGRPIECIEAGDINGGQRLPDGYVIIDRELLEEFDRRYLARVGSAWFSSHEGDFEGDRGRKFVLARLQQPTP